MNFMLLKGATKLYFAHYLCGVIILFNTSLDKSAFSTYSFGKLVFRLSAFSMFPSCSVFLFHLRQFYYNIYIIFVFIGVSYSMILFSLYKKQFVKTKTYRAMKI